MNIGIYSADQIGNMVYKYGMVYSDFYSDSLRYIDYSKKDNLNNLLPQIYEKLHQTYINSKEILFTNYN